MKNYILNFETFSLLEGILVDNGIGSIKYNYKIVADEHFYDRLSRDEYDIIEPDEVINDITKAMPRIALKNLFNNGIYWNGNKFNTELIVYNQETYLNSVIMIDKVKDNGNYIYNITVKTVMRKKDFIPSKKENSLKIEIK